MQYHNKAFIAPLLTIATKRKRYALPSFPFYTNSHFPLLAHFVFVMKPAPQHHVPQDAVALQITPHTNHPIPSNASRPSRASASSRTKRRPIGAPPVPVRTEFVFSSMNTYSVVLLCGDWSDWRPIRMTLEQGKICIHFR